MSMSLKIPQGRKKATNQERELNPLSLLLPTLRSWANSLPQVTFRVSRVASRWRRRGRTRQFWAWWKTRQMSRPVLWFSLTSTHGGCRQSQREDCWELSLTRAGHLDRKWEEHRLYLGGGSRQVLWREWKGWWMKFLCSRWAALSLSDRRQLQLPPWEPTTLSLSQVIVIIRGFYPTIFFNDFFLLTSSMCTTSNS